MVDRCVFLRSPRGLPSLESLFGWHDQYERMLRWHERLRDNHSLDFLLAFFLNCYAVRDWLVKSGVINEAELDSHIQSNFFMRLCRDLCNRSKHLVLSKPSVDAEFFICMEYKGESRGSAFVVHAWDPKTKRDEKTELEDIPTACVAFWNTLLTSKQLLPDSPIR